MISEVAKRWTAAVPSCSTCAVAFETTFQSAGAVTVRV